MPIYEFACERCGEQFDKLMSVNGPPPPCPHCGAGEVRKLISAASFVLKGGGWYKDHYGLKGGGGSSSEGAKSEGTKSDGGSKGGGGSSSEAA